MSLDLAKYPLGSKLAPGENQEERDEGSFYGKDTNLSHSISRSILSEVEIPGQLRTSDVGGHTLLE